MSELTTLRDQLKAGLSGATAEHGADALPTVAELAERIKTLGAAHTIEATPQRSGKRRASAEEPVTVRIRRRGQEAEGEWQRLVSKREESKAARA